MSEGLFGRYQAISIYRAIAKAIKPEFTTGMIASTSGAPISACSRELDRLKKLGLVRQTSRKGDYERLDSTCFWTFIEEFSRECEG